MAKKGMKHYNAGDKYRSDVYHKTYTQKELLAIHHRMAKVANQRMVRIERATSALTGRPLTSGHMYKVAVDYLQSQGRRRFSESKGGYGVKDLRHEISVLEYFLNAPTSLVSKAKLHEMKIYKALKKKMPSLSPAEMYEFQTFLATETFKKLSSEYDSEQLIEVYNRAAGEGKNAAAIREAFETFRKQGGATLKGLGEELGVTVI